MSTPILWSMCRIPLRKLRKSLYRAVRRPCRWRRLSATLSLGTVSEILANSLFLEADFGLALFHLDHLILERMHHNLGQRPELQQRLTQAVATGSLVAAETTALLYVADLQAHLPFTLEVAPFFRSGQTASGQELEATFTRTILPHLEPEAAGLYATLRHYYEHLPQE
ncbi:MAG: hypothetical protein FD153_832 [Rhodospirillaceae bacterium]|nr:MAG: hypothetical protein FD153_832 [Rhodospirillaceae bacterium]